MEKMESELQNFNLDDFLKFVSLINYYRDKVPKQEPLKVAEEVEWPLLSPNNIISKDMSLSEFVSQFVKGREICVKSLGPSKHHVVKILEELGQQPAE